MKLNLPLEMPLLSIFLRQKVKTNQNLTKKPSFGTPCEVLTSLLTLSLRKTLIGIFPHYFSFSPLWPLPAAFGKND